MIRTDVVSSTIDDFARCRGNAVHAHLQIGAGRLLQPDDAVALQLQAVADA